MAMRLISATGRLLAALALLAAVCACATTATEPSVRTRPPGWRIVERTGEARYLPPESAGWIAATTGQALAGGSEVATGRGGRLIVDAPGRHLSVGPDSRFVLPNEDGEAWLEQRAGWLRYRIAEGAAEPFPDLHPSARAAAVLRGDRRSGQPSWHRGQRQGGPGLGRHPRWPAPDPDDRRPVGARRRGWRHGAGGSYGTGPAASRSSRWSCLRCSPSADLPASPRPRHQRGRRPRYWLPHSRLQRRSGRRCPPARSRSAGPVASPSENRLAAGAERPATSASDFADMMQVWRARPRASNALQAGGQQSWRCRGNRARHPAKRPCGDTPQQTRAPDRWRARWHSGPPPCPIGAQVDQMKDPARLMSRSGLAAAPMVPGRSSALERQKSAPLRPGTWLLLALLLAVTAPAYGFDDKEPSSQAVDDLVLHGLDVPAAANWVVLDANGIAAWRAEGDTRWQRFSRGEVLPPGCEIETGSISRSRW